MGTLEHHIGHHTGHTGTHGRRMEKIYLQGKLAGQRRADEAASAQYLR